MKNFNWTEFTKRIHIKSDLRSVYNAWTQKSELEKWFLASAVFTSDDNSELSPEKNVSAGCKYKWNWFAQNAFEEGLITEANGTDYLKFTFAGNCKVSVKLTKQEEYTFLELTQSEIPTDDLSKENIRLGCDLGWTFYLTNLKSVLEGGLDLRNKDISLKGVVNN